MLVTVKPISELTRVIGDPMIQWIKSNEGKNFWVESKIEGSVKLKKVGFWISEDLIEEV